MDAESAFVTSIEYEKKIRDIYRSALSVIESETGRTIFGTLADDEQSHVDFLEYSLSELKKGGRIDLEKLKTTLPPLEIIEKNAEKMSEKIPEHVYGDVKRLLNSALEIEVETSAFYKRMTVEIAEPFQSVFHKFLKIEEGHIEAVQIELDYASNNGFWFNFMETDLED